MKPTSPLMKLVYLVFVLLISSAGGAAAQSLVADQNYISLKVDDTPATIKFTQDSKLVDVTCDIPAPLKEAITIVPGKPGSGTITITGKAPSQGMVIGCHKDSDKDKNDEDKNSTVNIYVTRIGVHSTGKICDDLAMMRSQAERIRFFANMVPRMSDADINDTLDDCERDKISATPTILDYKTVRDNYGKGIGESFAVIQINIRNRSTTSQFYLQDVVVALDPKKCVDAIQFFRPMYQYDEPAQDGKDENGLSAERMALNDAWKSRRDKFANKCLEDFDTFFTYPIGLDALGRDKVLGVANANLYRSPRKIAFEIADFVSAMNPVLSGLKWLGRDGKLGFGFLGTPIISEAKKGIPSIADEKFNNLNRSLPDSAIIVPSGGSAVVNVFVETQYFFNKETFPLYMMNATDATKESQHFDRLLKLFLVSSVTGKLISNDAPTLSSTPKGGTPSDAFKNP